MAIVMAAVTGCTLLAEQSGRLLDGSALAEKTLERYRTESGDMELRRVLYRNAPSGEESGAEFTGGETGAEGYVLTLKAWPTLRFTFVREGDALYPVAYTFLASGVSGWNEFTVELQGGGTLTAAGGDRLVLALDGPEETDLSSGGIRRFDTRLSGEAALSALRNRRERIAALAEWMAAYDRAAYEAAGTDASVHTVRRFTGRREFEKRWKGPLFSAELPGNLKPLRDSETLLDDWEEASAWIHLVFEWDHIIQMITTPTTLIKK